MSNNCNVDVRSFLPASFKGIPFPVKNVSDVGGRRGVVGEFPFSENTDYVDLGAKANQFSLSGTFSGKYHLENSRLFFEACKSPDAGVLLHPIRGVLFVACTRIELSNDLYEGINVTDYKADFVETPQNLTFENIFKTLASLGIAHFIQSFIDSFKSSYNYKNILWFEQDAIINVLGQTISILKETYETNSVANATTKWSVVQNMHELNIRELSESGEDISVVLYNAIAFIFRDSSDTVLNQINLCKQLLNAMSFGSDYKNSNLIICYVRILLLSHLLSFYKKDKDLLSSDLLDTIQLIDTVFNDELEILQEFSFYDLYSLVFKFRVEALRFFYMLFYSSKTKITYTFNGSVPPLVAAWEIYRDAKRSDDLRNLNEVTNLVIGNKVEAIV